MLKARQCAKTQRISITRNVALNGALSMTSEKKLLNDMNIKTARKKFDTLKDQILAGGRIDITEANVLLDFIASYINFENPEFVDFKNLLLKCVNTEKITEDESKMLVEKINEMLTFLKIEQVVEWVFVGIVAVMMLFGLMTLF